MDPIPGWAARALVATETSFGVPADPLLAQALEFSELDMGPIELGAIRAKKDRAYGRAMQAAFIEGRVEPIEFSLETAIKKRVANTTPAKEAVLYKAGGLIETVGGSSVGYTLSLHPTVPSLSVLRALGSPALETEWGRGGIVKNLEWTGGEAELALKASGAFVGKRAAGSVASITLADGSGTALTVTSDEAYRMGLGYYICESEIIEVTAITYSSGAITIERAQLSTSGAAHAAKPLYPYCPALTANDDPISEMDLTVTLDGDSYRCTKFGVTLATGVDHLPAESGSKYRQGLKVTRCDVKATLALVLKGEDLMLLHKANQKKSCALTIVAGAGAGGIVTFSLPQVELDAFAVPSPADDISAVDLSLRCRDSEDTEGNDVLTVTHS